MKKQNLTLIIAGLLITVSLLLAGCTNAFGPLPGLTGAEPGKGTVIVSFSAGKSALSPNDLNFSSYKFTFIREGAVVLEAETGNTGSFTFSLPQGNGYTLEVEAYRNDGSTEVLAATGTSAVFEVKASGTSVMVGLKGVLFEGVAGTFTFAIEYPVNADLEEFALINDEDLYIDLFTEARIDGSYVKGAISHSVAVQPGNYFLIVRLSREDGRAAGYSNGVVIYSNNPTNYFQSFDSASFKTQMKGMPLRVADWHGFNIAGKDHFGNNDRLSEGFGELGSIYAFDRGRAIGTLYDNFIDDRGKSWTDVLKLEPPKDKNPANYLNSINVKGYPSWTMIMTYPIANSGLYSLSMDIWAEGGSKSLVHVLWHTCNPATDAWGQIVNENIFQEEWVSVSGSSQLYEGMEIGILAWNDGGSGTGLDDATIYIKNLMLQFNGEPIIDTNTEVIVTPDSLTLLPGRTAVLTANRGVYWASANNEIAMIDADGVVTAVAIGETVITAVSKTDSGKTADVLVSVVAELPKKHIVLSFDDGPNSEITPQVLNLLAEFGAHATFFCTGVGINGNPDLAWEMVHTYGNEIGNHSYEHQTNNNLGNYNYLRSELIKTQIAIENAIGYPATSFRAPTLTYETGGSSSSNNEWQYGYNLELAAGSLGLPLIDATGHQLGNYDWDSNFDANAIFERAKLLAKDGGILLLHDNNYRTLGALRLILEWLTEQNYEVHSVREMTALRNIPALVPGRIYYDFNDINGIPDFQGEVVPVNGITVRQNGTEVSSEGVFLSEEVLSIALTAEISPVNASLQKVYWFSENDAIATVNENGVVAAIYTGTTTIRAVAGIASKKVKVTVGGSMPSTEWEPLVSWDDIEYPTGGIEGFCTPSGAGNVVLDDFIPGDGFLYENILSIYPLGNDYLNNQGPSFSFAYKVPFDGNYYLSMDVWANQTENPVDLVCYEFDKWIQFIDLHNVPKNYWNELRGSTRLKADTYIGLVAKNYDGSISLGGTTINVKNLTLTVDLDTGETVTIIDITSPRTPLSPDDPPPVETHTSWTVFDWAGKDALGETGAGYQGSNAVGTIIDNYRPGDGFSYSNVLELVPPPGGYTYDTDLGGTVGMNYTIEKSGWYTLSMDVWVDSDKPNVNLIWYVCGGSWAQLNTSEWEGNVATNVWLSGTGPRLYIEAGTIIGLLTRNNSDAYGLRDATIYIKNLKLELESSNNPIIEINSTASQAPNDPVITLQWGDNGSLVEAEAVSVAKGGTVAITAPPDLPMYQWRVGREIYTGMQTFVFDSTDMITGTYTVGFYSGTEFGGDAVKITVTK